MGTYYVLVVIVDQSQTLTWLVRLPAMAAAVDNNTGYHTINNQGHAALRRRHDHSATSATYVVQKSAG